jgi:PIN domain nuclease of toxin-antitoxin system
MLRAIADTHVVIWYLFNDSRLSPTAKAFIETAAMENNQIGISSLTLAEIIYLIEKERIPRETLTRLIEALDQADSVLTEIVFDRRVAESLSRVERASIPDLPDRIIAATAVCLGLPLISRDGKIRVSGIETIW